MHKEIAVGIRQIKKGKKQGHKRKTDWAKRKDEDQKEGCREIKRERWRETSVISVLKVM